MSDVTKKILDIIKGKNIKPKPRWHFVLRQVAIWLLAVASVVIGSFVFSVMIFRLVNNDWEVIKFLNRTPLQHFFSSLPLVWILLLIVFIALAYYNARHTKGAYKYQGYWFIIGSIVISMTIGGIFYAFGLAPRVHFAAEKLPFMKELMYDRNKIWMNADDGFLAGEVTGMLSGVGMFALEDLNEETWIIIPASSYVGPPPQFVIEEGVMVRIMGAQVDDETFEAERVMPYYIGPGMMKGKMLDLKKNGGPKNFLFGR